MAIKRHLLVQHPADRQSNLLILDNGFIDHALFTSRTTSCMNANGYKECLHESGPHL
jgi:hypothetical protein